MLSNKNKKGAIAIFMVLLVPVVLMLFSVMLDGILTQNIKNATRRYLDESTMAAVIASSASGCIISDAEVNIGIDLFKKNMAESGMTVSYRILPLRNAAKDSFGIVSYIVLAEATDLLGNRFVPIDYSFRYVVESTAVCSSD